MTQQMTQQNIQSSTLYLKLIAVPILWGGTFIAGRIASAQLPAASSSWLRFVFASLSLLLILHFTQGLQVLRTLTHKQWLATAALGATGILSYNLFFFNALALIPASRTAMFVALNPVITILLATLFLGERLRALRWFGVLLALVGVLTVVTRGDFGRIAQSFGRGECLMLGAVTSWAVYTLIGRSVLSGLSPLVATTCAALWGTLFLSVVAAPTLADLDLLQVSGHVWVSLMFLGVLGTALAFVWYYEGIQKLGTARAVIFNNLVPVFGVLLAWLILGESIDSSLLLGGSLAIAGVFLVNRV